MSEYKTITLPISMPLTDRISGVSKEISKWLDSLDEPFNVESDVIQLVKFECDDRYSYHYILERAAKGPKKPTGARKNTKSDAQPGK